jgi:catechol 2,3-dioxygenase-like lactoylglutathione lyase family enzyme
MSTVQVRYIVNDVDTAIDFYTTHLDFQENMHPAPNFAMLSRGDLRLVLSAPSGQNTGGGSTLPDGRTPEPGGWNRFAVQVDDITTVISQLRQSGVRFRSDLIEGVGGRQAIIEDPSGNPIELFQPIRPEARLSEPESKSPVAE